MRRRSIRTIEYPLDVDGVITRVLEAGSGDDYIVMVHGVGARADRWRLNLQSLATTGRHAFAFDLPGHGFASKGGGFDYSLQGYTHFLEQLLTRLDVQSTALSGTSLGGHVSARFACDHPGRVTALILIGSLGLSALGSDLRSRIARAIRDTSPQGIEQKLRALVHDPALVTREWIDEEWRVNNSKGAGEGFDLLAQYFTDHIDEEVLLGDLRQISSDVPILIVWGREDKILPASVGEAAGRVLTKAQIELVEGAGHAPYLERAAEFNVVVAEFLASLLASRRDELGP